MENFSSYFELKIKFLFVKMSTSQLSTNNTTNTKACNRLDLKHKLLHCVQQREKNSAAVKTSFLQVRFSGFGQSFRTK